jgi:O-antigen/teichoic acid export membrane protein
MNENLGPMSYMPGDGDGPANDLAYTSAIGRTGEIVGKLFGKSRASAKRTIKSLWTKVAKGIGIGGRSGGSRPIAASSFGALSVYAAGAGLSYISQLLVARTIGADSFGIYSYVLAWVTLLAYLSTLGFHVSLLRFVPAYRAKQRWSLARGVIQYSQRGALGVGLCVILIGACIILARYKFMLPELAMTFLLGIVTVPIISQHLISASVVRAFGGIVKALAPERVVRDGVLLIVVAIASWSGVFLLDAKLAMAASLIGALATLGVLKFFFGQLRPVELEGERPVFAVREWLQPTLPIMFIVVADTLMSRSGVIVLGLTGNTRDAGVFAVALSMSLLTALPRMAVAAAFAPTVSDLYTRDDQTGLQALAAKASVLSLVGTLGIAIPLLLLNAPLLALFGQTYVAGAPLVIALVLAQVFAAACGPQQHIITMTGNERSGATIMITCAVANLTACMLAIDSYGTMGVALAMSATLVVWNLAMGVYIRQRLHMLPGLVSALESMRNKD